MDYSCGIAILHNGLLLLGHPTNAPWTGTFSIPKGLLEDNETYISAAIRETFEEVGITIDVDDIDEKYGMKEILYRNRRSVYKKLLWFVADISHIPAEEISPMYPILPKSQLQVHEVDWAGFMSKDEIIKSDRIFWRQKPILEIL